jgi:hypothetical protein
MVQLNKYANSIDQWPVLSTFHNHNEQHLYNKCSQGA